MPKGDIVTTIPSGQKLKVEWHLGYAHRGGFKIELLNDQGYQDIDFTPQGFVGSENTEVTFIIQGISWQSEQSNYYPQQSQITLFTLP